MASALLSILVTTVRIHMKTIPKVSRSNTGLRSPDMGLGRQTFEDLPYVYSKIFEAQHVIAYSEIVYCA